MINYIIIIIAINALFCYIVCRETKQVIKSLKSFNKAERMTRMANYDELNTLRLWLKWQQQFKAYNDHNNADILGFESEVLAA